MGSNLQGELDTIFGMTEESLEKKTIGFLQSFEPTTVLMLRASQDAGAEDWRGWNSSQCRSLGTFGEGFDFILASNFKVAKIVVYPK